MSTKGQGVHAGADGPAYVFGERNLDYFAKKGRAKTGESMSQSDMIGDIAQEYRTNSNHLPEGTRIINTGEESGTYAVKPGEYTSDSINLYRKISKIGEQPIPELPGGVTGFLLRLFVPNQYAAAVGYQNRMRAFNDSVRFAREELNRYHDEPYAGEEYEYLSREDQDEVRALDAEEKELRESMKEDPSLTEDYEYNRRRRNAIMNDRGFTMEERMELIKEKEDELIETYQSLADDPSKDTPEMRQNVQESRRAVTRLKNPELDDRQIDKVIELEDNMSKFHQKYYGYDRSYRDSDKGMNQYMAEKKEYEKMQNKYSELMKQQVTDRNNGEYYLPHHYNQFRTSGDVQYYAKVNNDIRDGKYNQFM